jgi:fibro-slime domain-containing protein
MARTTTMVGAIAFVLVISAAGCGGGDVGDGSDLHGGDGDGGTFDVGGGGTGTGTGLDGSNLDGNGGGGGDTNGHCGTKLTGVLRDFHSSHPDFEKFLGDDRGIVKDDLGADQKPVYAGAPTTPTTTGKANFDQWYRDVDGVNLAFPYDFTLGKGAGDVYTYENNSFFPLDDKGFGDEGNPHNYHFTFELHTTFLYSGGETFTFVGDDDLWTFINKKLAINLGGVHGAESQSVDLDSFAAGAGIQKGKIYALDLFFAERHTVASEFRIDTTLDFVDCGTGIH